MANFMMFASLGEGFLAMPIGYAMGFYGPWMLYFTELAFAVFSFILVRKVIEILDIGSKSTFLIEPI